MPCKQGLCYVFIIGWQLDMDNGMYICLLYKYRWLFGTMECMFISDPGDWGLIPSRYFYSVLNMLEYLSNSSQYDVL